MHDPQTLAFCFWRLWEIWHVDPETDGTDDSCGWFTPRLTKRQALSLKASASMEAEYPWAMREEAKRPSSPADAEALLRGVLLDSARCCKVKVTWDEVCMAACELLHDPLDNVRNLLCFLPGYHSNRIEDTKNDRRYNAERLWRTCGSYWLRKRRRWWQHPRWHVWHWRVRIPIWRTLKQWLFGMPSGKTAIW